MAYERNYKLGDDMLSDDSILDPITFEELIMTLHCNTPRNAITREAVIEEARKIVEQRLADFWYLVNHNINEIIDQAKNY